MIPRLLRTVPFFILLLSIPLFPLNINAQAPRESKHGVTFPTRGTMKVLVVFAEQVGGCSLGNTQNWPDGELPVNTHEYFDSEVPLNGNTTPAKLTRLYYQASYGQLTILGDYLDHMVQVPCSLTGTNAADNAVRQYLTDLFNNGNPQFLNGSDLSEFDSWGGLEWGNRGREKINQPNGSYDALAVIWKNSPYGCGSGLAFQPNWTTSTTGQIVCDNNANFGICWSTEDKIDFVGAELFHPIFGGNHFHTGAGAGVHTFSFLTNPWGLSTQMVGTGISNVVCGWDRWFLDYIHPDKQHALSALSLNYQEIETDLSLDNASPGVETYRLRDFVTTGDVIRLKLPHINWQALGDAKNQYLWLENHQLITQDDHSATYWNCNEPLEAGVMAMIQVGKDRIVQNVQAADPSVYSSGPHSSPNALGSHLFPLTANGNWDYSQGSVQDIPKCPDNPPAEQYVRIGDGWPGHLANPFTGFSDLFGMYDTDQDGAIFPPGNSDYLSSQAQTPYFASTGTFGDPELVYANKGNQKTSFSWTSNNLELDLCGNPAPVPIYTNSG